MSAENLKLKQELSEAETRTGELQDKNAEFHRDVLYYKNLVAPLRERAKQLYPELETAAALAKLAEDLQAVRSLATQDKYKQLSPARRERLLSGLIAILAEHARPRNIVLGVEQGNSPRMRVADDLKSILTDAGFSVDMRPQQTFRRGVPPDVSIIFNPVNSEFVIQFANAIGTIFINRQFAGIRNEGLPESTLEIELNGDALFTDDGVVTFR